MSLKRYGVASVVGGLALASALPVCAATGDQQNNEFRGIYAELDGGWEARNLSSFISGNFSDLNLSNTKNSKGAWQLGTAFGYQFNNTFSVEAGYWRVPYTSGTINGTEITAKLDGWFAYLAGKASIPLAQNLSLFGKFGPVYTHVRAKNVSQSGDGFELAEGSSAVSHYWDVMFAVGTEYAITPKWTANVQFMRAPGHDDSDSADYAQPRTSVYSAGIAYKLAM